MDQKRPVQSIALDDELIVRADQIIYAKRMGSHTYVKLDPELDDHRVLMLPDPIGKLWEVIKSNAVTP